MKKLPIRCMGSLRGTQYRHPTTEIFAGQITNNRHDSFAWLPYAAVKR